MLNLSALFISQKRLNEVLRPNALPYAALQFSFADRNSDGMLRRQVLTAYEDAAIIWLSSAKLPSLGELLMENKALPGAFFTHIGPFFGRNTMEADIRYGEGKGFKKEVVVWTKLDGFEEGLTLTVQAHPENYTTRSAAGEMAGKKRLFMVGRLTETDFPEMRAQAYIIGHLHEELRPEETKSDPFYALPHRMEIFPVMVDNFSKAQDESAPSAAELKQLLEIPEKEIKKAFAEIIGEPFVPKDWGGETSDLVSTQVRIGGQQVATAFAFKGPAKAKKMTMADLGKNGDQISRLYSEPVDFVVLQHCHMVTSAVRDHMRAFSTRIGRLRPFCIIDGADTARILRAYSKCGFGRLRKTSL
jgi:hypothetical protein